MPADTPQPDARRDPLDGTAAIPPVTDAMLDHAAHEAAALADGVARHTVHLDHPAVPAAEAAAPEALAAPQGAGEVAERAVAAAAAAARTVAEAAGTTVDAAAAGAAQVAGTVAEHARHAAETASDAAPDKLSASADALGQYNAKVIEVVRTNLASATALVGALLQAKSVPEALSINADHLRRQVETLTGQSRDLANLAQTIAFDALRPFRGRPER